MSAAHRHHDAPDELVALERYRGDILAKLRPLPPIDLPLLEAHGCVLAQDVTAEADVPPFANSAMDGYAVRMADAVEGAELVVSGEAAAGSPPGPPLTPGQAVRIMTGAPLPGGTEAVVPVEVATERDGRVLLAVAPLPGQHLRPPGQDVQAGELAVAAGSVLRAAAVGMLAAVGRDRVRVHPRPRVTVLSTGDELLEPGAALRPGAIRDANSYSLAAAAREAGAVVSLLPLVPDNREALRNAFAGALGGADLLVTSGGVSAGRYDYVKQVLGELGDVRFRKVAMQPGMPQAFGFLPAEDGRSVPCFGLPGNPVSAFVSFEALVRPALLVLRGYKKLGRPNVTAILEEPVLSPPGKVSLLRVLLRPVERGWSARTTGPQGSGLLQSVVAADGLAEIPAEVTELAVGASVLVHLLEPK